MQYRIFSTIKFEALVMKRQIHRPLFSTRELNLYIAVSGFHFIDFDLNIISR